MTIRQLCLHLRSLLKARTWADINGTALGSGAKVFGEKVAISAGARTSEILTTLGIPCAIIMPGITARDPQAREDPRVRQATIRVKIINRVAGDSIGQNVLVGAAIGDEGKSAGHGILEIAEQVEYELQDLGPINGAPIYVLGSTQPTPVELEDQGMVVFMDVEFDAKVTTSVHYPPCPVFTATGEVGQVSLTWSLAPDRFDRYRVVLRRASGATAPTSITGGTGVTVGAEDTSVTDSGLAIGTYSYALFQTYDERSATPDSDDHVSAAITQTSVSVT